MTITYSLEVSKARLLGFLKLLLRWKGSIYRLMYREMLIFTLLYYVIAVLYRYVLKEHHKRLFERISMYCRGFTDLVPITFVLGFYVALIVGRWWQQFMAIPWPDRLALHVSTYVQGMDEKGRMMRRAFVRYANLMFALTFQATSTVVKRRFPTLDHLEEAGLLTMEEKVSLEETPAPHGNWWIPGSWFCQLAWEARKEGRIHDDLHLKSLIDELLVFRGQCGMVWSYDWISIPLVYTQVVAISVYCFFAACLLGRQYLHEIPEKYQSNPSNDVDYYVPVFTLFQFFFYMGWLKVAEEMICPYGEDDDDFELNWILDRNVQVSYLAVDGLYRKHPKLTKDLFWDDNDPEIPYTAAAATYRKDPYLGSTFSMNLPARDMEWQIEPIQEEMVGAQDVESPHHGLRMTHSPLPHYARPKFLNTLLKGQSRLSLAGSRFGSKYGSKNSVLSGRGSLFRIPRSPSFSRQRSSLSGYGSRVGSVPSIITAKARKYTEVGGDGMILVTDQRNFANNDMMVPVDNRSVSKNGSMLTLFDSPMDAGLGKLDLVCADLGTNSVGQHSVVESPRDNTSASDHTIIVADESFNQDNPSMNFVADYIPSHGDISALSSGYSSGVGNLADQINVPPPLKEEPEPPEALHDNSGSNEHVFSSTLQHNSLQLLASKLDEQLDGHGDEYSGPDEGETNDEVAPLVCLGNLTEKELDTDAQSDSASSTDTEQRTVTSLSQLLPKK